jgi:3-deoxy-D-manno-octulosonic-acid transferase
MSRRSIPVYLISGIFRKNQVFFRWYGSWYLQMLHSFEHLFVQQESSLELLEYHGIHHASVSGDTRFDRVYQIAMKAGPAEPFQSFCGQSQVAVAGSTWPGDEDLIVRYINEQNRPLKWLIAPHEINESRIERLIRQISVRTQRYSSLVAAEVNDTEVIIIDTIGLLSSLYQYGHLAFIGGGFGKNIHNTLEAAVFGIPVLFGPQYRQFQEAVDLVGLTAAFPVSGYGEFKSALDRLLNDQELLVKSGMAAGEYVKSKLGATATILRQSMKDDPAGHAS